MFQSFKSVKKCLKCDIKRDLNFVALNQSSYLSNKKKTHLERILLIKKEDNDEIFLFHPSRMSFFAFRNHQNSRK